VSALRAYPTLLRVGLASAIAYRVEMFVWMLTMTMPLVSLALWSAVSASTPVGRFGQGEFIAYFLATIIVRQLTGSWVVWELIQDIKSGSLASRLLKPIHPLVAYSAENLAALPMRALLALPMTTIALVAGHAHLPRAPELIVELILSLMGAWFITFFIMVVIGSLSFFIESSTAIFEVWLVSFMLLSGYLLPIELFPAWVKDIAYLLPFRYTLGFPVEILIGMSSPHAITQGLAVQWTYVVASAAGAFVMWRAGMRRYAAFGG
jgi:ABC-2 type transport system permease protein